MLLVINQSQLNYEQKRILLDCIEESEDWRSWLEEDGAETGYDSELELLKVACEPLVTNQLLILETEVCFNFISVSVISDHPTTIRVT